MKKSIFYLNILVFILLFAAAKIEAVEVSLFEQTYYRGTGSPVTVTNTFSGNIGLATIRVTNGGLEDDSNEMVSSSHIELNGVVIIGPSNFNQNVGIIEIEENISEGINTIEITGNGIADDCNPVTPDNVGSGIEVPEGSYEKFPFQILTNK